MAQGVWTDRVAAPLDGVRRRALGRALRSRFVREVFWSRERRVAWILGLHACASVLLTIFFPAPLLVLVPLVLGVPHVASDLRYLVFRSPLGRTARTAALAGSAALVTINALGLSGVRFDIPSAEVLVGCVFVAVLGALGAASVERAPASKGARGPAVLGAIVLLAYAATRSPRTALVVLLHVHNVVALVVWLWLFRARVRSVLAPLAVVAVCTICLVSGASLHWTLSHGVWRAFGTNLLAAADWLAPGVPGTLGVGLAASFVFLQSVHYLVWLVLVPADERRGNGSVSFRRSLRDFSRDLGAPFAACLVGAWVLFAALGTRAPLATKNAYLALASFHVWLELGVLAHHAVRGRATGSPASVPS